MNRLQSLHDATEGSSRTWPVGSALPEFGKCWRYAKHRGRASRTAHHSSAASPDGERLPKADVVMTNPPFGTKKGGGRPTRSDFSITADTSNKQLAFVEHVVRTLKPGGRAAMVAPDNVLFEDNTGRRLRTWLIQAKMKRLSLRYKKWLLHRQRYVSSRRKTRANNPRLVSTHTMVALYATVQHLARQLAYSDSFYVVWAYSQYLQRDDFQIPNGIEVAPQFLAATPPQALLAEWTLEQIVREVIQYGSEISHGGRSLRQWATLAQIANALRDLEGEINKRLVGPKKLYLEMMRISHRQFIWQQGRLNGQWIIRYYKLYNTPTIDKISQQATGLSIDHVYLIGMTFLGSFFGRPFVTEPIKVELPGVDEEHVERFLRFASLDLVGLGAKLKLIFWERNRWCKGRTGRIG
jgi:hypothetical protein